jgi:hypothetical protein
MLPIIIGAVSLIAYGLFDENSKPKAVKKMAKGGNVFNPDNTPLTFKVYDGEKVVFKTKSLNKASDYITINGKHLSVVSFDSNGNSKKIFAKGGTTESSDRKYSALKSGKRTSRKYASVEMRGGGVYHRRNANQYGKVKGGKTYYEYSENRTDSKRYLEKGGEVDTWENILVDYGFKKSRTKLGVKFYKKGKYFASVDNRRRMVELYFDDIELYIGYSIQGLIDELDKEFKH